MANCIDNVLKKFPEADRKSISDIFDSMTQDAKEGFLDAAGNPDAAFMEKAQKRIDAYKRGVMKAEIKALQNITKSAKNDAFAKNPAFSSVAEGRQAKLTGTPKNVEGGNRSVAQDIVARANKLTASFNAEMDKMPGAAEAYKSGAIDKEILVEQADLLAGGKGGKTNNELALGIAKARIRLNDEILLMLNDSGALVDKLEGRLMQRVYEREKLLKVSKDDFVNRMIDSGWIDSDRSFKKDFHVQDAHEVLGDIYDKVTAAREFELNLDGDDSRAALRKISSPANMARALERGRTIHFVSPEAEYQFMQEFGTDTLADDTARSIKQISRKTAMISQLGTSPEQEVRRWMRGMDDGDKKMLLRHWANVTGEANAPGVDARARWGRNLRLLADVRSLSMSALSHINNIATRAGLLQVEGDNFFSGLAKSISSMTEGMTAEQKAEIHHRMGLLADSHMGQFYDQFGTTEGGVSGFFTKAHQNFMKAFGIRWMGETHEAANGVALSDALGYHSDKPYSALDPQKVNVMRKYAIGPVDWEVMRQSAVEHEGSKFVDIKTVGEMPKEQVKEIMEKGGLDTSGREVGKFQRELQTKLANYFQDRSNAATGRPGAYEKAAFLNRGNSEQTLDGQLFRFFGQFKGYGLTMATKGARNYYYEALEGKSIGQKAMTVAPLMTSMMALGYISWASKELLKGKTAPTPYVNGEFDRGLAVKIAEESLMRGGVGGIYSDYLLGEFDSRHGRSALSAFAGPVLGQANDVADLLTEFRTAAASGDPEKMKASALTRFVTNNTIGNMAVVRQGLDYLFLNDMAETLNPGYTQRMQRRLEQQGQGTWAPWAPH